jgi:hypothetical protein
MGSTVKQGAQQTILVCGKSFTGKTVLSRSLVAGLGRPVYIANDPSPPKPFRKVSWDKLAEIRDAAVILEDVISCTDAEFKMIQHLMSYAAHHSGISPAVLICHSVLKNRIHAVLGYVNYIYFTLTPSNATSIGAALRYFRFTKEEQEAMIKRFLGETKGTYGSFCLNVEERTFEKMDGKPVSLGSNDKVAPAVPKRSRDDFVRAAERFLPLLPEPKLALAAFEIIVRKIPLASLSPDDLSIELRLAESGGKLTLSLIDYLNVLTTNSRPSTDMFRLHRYIRKYVTVPDFFRKNRRLR